MTPLDIEDALRAIRYKPSWKFKLDYEIGFQQDRIYITGVFTTIDSTQDMSAHSHDYNVNAVIPVFDPFAGDRGGFPNTHPMYRTTDVNITIMIPGDATISAWTIGQFLFWFRENVLRVAEEHEMDEWFRYKGELVHDPHEAEKAAKRKRARDAIEDMLRSEGKLK